MSSFLEWFGILYIVSVASVAGPLFVDSTRRFVLNARRQHEYYKLTRPYA